MGPARIPASSSRAPATRPPPNRPLGIAMLKITNHEVQGLLDRANLLPDDDRADLIEALLAGLDPTFAEGAEDAWHEELDRRAPEIDEEAVQRRAFLDIVGRLERAEAPGE